MRTDMIRTITTTDWFESRPHRDLFNAITARAVDHGKLTFVEQVKFIERVGRTWELTVQTTATTTKVVRVPVVGNE